MVNGMFTTWDSTTKRLKTTNIVPSSSFLYFGDNKTVSLNYSSINEGLLRINTNNQHLEIFTGNTYTNFRSTRNKFQFIGDLYSTGTKYALTFKRSSDNSEVLYHADIINDLTTGGTNKVLSAEQGKLLKNSITSIQGSYLPLSGGTMTGSIIFPNRKGIFGTLTDGTSNIKIAVINANNNVEIGNSNTPLMLVSNSTDLTHYRDNNTYKIWDKFNLPDPATLSGNNVFTGNNTFQAGKFNVGPFGVTSSGSLLSNINLQEGSAWSRSLTFRANSDNTSKSIFGGYNSIDNTSAGYAYIGIGDVNHSTAQYKFYSNKFSVSNTMTVPESSFRIYTGNMTLLYYNKSNKNVQFGPSDSGMSLELLAQNLYHTKYDSASSTWKNYTIYSEYNLTNPVTYTTNAYNHATLKNKDGQYFTYIKAGTNGLLPHSKATLTSGGSGSLGTSDQSFNAAYINNLHTNKVTFGDAGPYIIGSTSATQFLNAEGGVQKVATGGLYVGISYASDALNLVPTNGIYSKGIIYIENGIGFKNSIWTNDLTPNRNYSGYLQVLDAYYDAANVGGPTNYGTVLQINSRIDHWANQLWFGNNDNMYLRRMNYGSTTYGKWNRLLTNKDVNILSASYKNDPNSLPINQIFYAETHDVTGTPTDNGLLFSVQGNDEGIQLWASSTRTELYYRTKWTSFGNWIKLVTTSDLNSYLTKTEASTLYYPYNGRGYLSITSTGKPVMSNNQGYAVKDKDGNEREVLWMGTDNTLNLGNTSQYTLNKLDLRCTTLTHNGSSIATQNYVTNQLSNYLPLTGGTLSGNLTINTVGSTTFVINNNDTNGSETFMRVLRKGTASAAIGFRDSLGAYIYNYNSNKYLFIDNDGYARVGTTSGSTRLALITDIPTVSGYLPLSGGTLTGTLKINSGGSEPLVINNSASAGEAYVVTKTQGTTRGVMGWNSSLGMFLQDNRGYTFSVKADGVYFGASSSTLTKLPTSTDLSNYLPLTGGNLTGKLSIKSSGSNLLILDSSSSTESVIHFLRSSTTKGAVGYYDNIGAFIYNFPSNTYLFVKDDGKPYVGTKTNYKKILTETDITGYATQSWVNNQGYLTSHQTIYNLTFQAGTFAAKTFDPNGAAATVNIPTNTSHLTNDSGYTTQEWVNGQGFLTSDSLLDKFVPTTGGYIRNSDQVLLRLQRTGVSTGTSRTIEMYFDDSNTDGTSTTPRGSIGYNSEVGMFLYSAKSKKFLAMEYTGRPFYGTPENRYYLLGSNTEYHNLDGYQRIGDIMIQWGYFSVQGNSTRAVNFPVSFTNTVWSVTGSWDNTATGSQENWGFTDYTSSGFTIINGDGSSRVFHYIAIGPFTRS